MKKAVIYLITMLILCGCKANRTVSENNKNITFINEVKEADVWILPETEENLKTTVWEQLPFWVLKQMKAVRLR